MERENNFKDRDAYRKIKKARTSLILQHPFFASLALHLQVQEDYSCHTAWTDGKIFGYNPHYVNMLSSDKLEGLAAHIVMHPACGHHTRRGNRDKTNWNKACDYVINGILLDSGFTLPDGYLFKEEYNERSAEAVYTILSEDDGDTNEDEEISENQQDIEENRNNEGQDQESDKGRPDENEEDGKDEGAAENSDPGLSGEVRDSQDGSSNGEGDKPAIDWDDALIQAAIAARGMGRLPSSVERLLDRHLHPELDWQELLRRFVERNARSDYSWIQPNKRFIHQNIYLPSLRNSELESVFIAIDTSGSISEHDLERFAAEISEILAQYPATIHLIYCDYRISEQQQYSRSELPIVIKPTGGGGTDYRPVFNFIEAESHAPACLVYLTDLECKSYPKTTPDYPVLWVSVGENANNPPFGEIIRMKRGTTNEN